MLAAAVVAASRGSLFDFPLSIGAIAVLAVASLGLFVSFVQRHSGRWSAAAIVAIPLLVVPAFTTSDSPSARTLALSLPHLAIAGAVVWQRRLVGWRTRLLTWAVVASVSLAVVMDLLFRDPYRQLNCTPLCPVSPWAVEDRPDLVAAAGWLVLAIVLLAGVVAARTVMAVRPAPVLRVAVVCTVACMTVGAVALRWRSDHRTDSAFAGWTSTLQLLFIAAAACTALVPAVGAYAGRHRARRWATAIEGASKSEGAVALLRRAADDPTLELVDSPVVAPGRATTTLRRAGRTVAVVEHRHDSGERLRAAISPTMAALVENDLLLDRARLQLDELREARRLAIERIDDARSRLQRDLHDGAQQHLIALGMNLSMVATQSAEPARSSLDLAARHAARALDRLRSIAHADVPPLLDDGGLVEALVSLAEDCEVDLEMSLTAAPCPRLPREVEHAAYRFVMASVREAADAGSTRVTVMLSADDGLTLTTSHAANEVTARIADRDRIEAASGSLSGCVEGTTVVYVARFP
jgi:signal transduction histidine kinase